MKKKIIVFFSIIVGSFIIVYLAVSFSISNKASKIIKSSYSNNGAWTSEMDGIISPKNYSRINYRSGYPSSDKPYYEKTFLTVEFTFHNLKKAATYYKYSYERIDKLTNEVTCGSLEIPCKLYWKLIDWHWTVTEYYEEP